MRLLDEMESGTVISFDNMNSYYGPKLKEESQTGKPLVNQMFNGADSDKTSVQILFSRFQFNNKLFLVDRGFNTETDKKLIKLIFCSESNAAS